MEISVDKSHDSLFKKVFRDVDNTRDFLKSYLPKDLASRVDFDSMSMSATEKDDAEYNSSYLDLTVECKLDGKDSKIYIIFEHKSYQDSMTLMQIMRYCMLIWEDEIKANKKSLTPIIPFIFYHGERKSALHSNFRDYFDITDDLKKYLLSFEMVIFDTDKVTNNEIRENINNLFVVSAILMMKNIFNDVNQIKPILKDIIELSDDRKIIFFEYFATKKKMTEKSFNKLITELKGEEMPSLAKMWRDEGLEIGREIGREIGEKRGRLKEIQDTIKMGFEAKFSQLSYKLLLQIEKITEIKKLQEIKRAIFMINDADEFQQFVKKTI